MEVLKDIVLAVSLVGNVAAITKHVLDGRKAHRESAKQAEAERQLTRIVKTLQKPTLRGTEGVVFNQSLHAGAELGVAKGILAGKWHNGSLWVRFATFSGKPDAAVDEEDDVGMEEGDPEEQS